MVTFQDILLGGVLPALVVAVVLFAERTISGWWARSANGSAGSITWPLAAAGGYLLGHSLQQDFDWFAPAEAIDWLPWITLAAGGVGALLGYARTARFAASAVPTFVVTVAGLYLVARPRLEHAWSGTESIAWVVLPALMIGAAWGMLARNARSTAEPTASQMAIWEQAIAWLLVAMAGGLTLMFSGTGRYGEMAGTMIFVTLALLLVAAWKKAAPLLPAAIGTLFVPFGVLLVAGRLYASLTLMNLLLLAAALLLATVPLPHRERRTPLVRWLIRLVAVAVPLGIVLTVAGLKFAKDLANPAPY